MVPQEESDGGEDHHGGTHGPTSSDLLPWGAMVVQSTEASPPIERLKL